MANGLQRFGVKPWNLLICQLMQMLGIGLAGLGVREVELQPQANVVEAGG